MELKQEEIEALLVAKVESEKKIKERDKRREEVVKLFNSSQLTNIRPIWHTKIEDIDLTLQKENLDAHLLDNGFTIIENVDIELLFNNMYSGNPEMFREKILYNKNLSDEKISDILYNWINDIKLIPPTILVIDNTINNFVTNTNHLFATDGKHRLNVAYYYGATQVPIFVINKQLEKVKTILNLNID